MFKNMQVQYINSWPPVFFIVKDTSPLEKQTQLVAVLEATYDISGLSPQYVVLAHSKQRTYLIYHGDSKLQTRMYRVRIKEINTKRALHCSICM